MSGGLTVQPAPRQEFAFEEGPRPLVVLIGPAREEVLPQRFAFVLVGGKFLSHLGELGAHRLVRLGESFPLALPVEDLALFAAVHSRLAACAPEKIRVILLVPAAAVAAVVAPQSAAYIVVAAARKR